MDSRQAAAYVDRMFGTARGYVAVAVKEGKDWNERTFQWPRGRDDLLAWASKHAVTGHVFICPALRSKSRRQKGDGRALGWLWADVDWEKVPASRVENVKARIAQLGTVTVASGTGDNAHVYVKLTRRVDVAEHARLNTGLRNYLFADNKQADNSLLRLPGTTNWKTTDGVAVRMRRGNGQTRSPETLLRLKTFAAVTLSTPATGGTAVAWTKVDVSGVPKAIVRKTRMSEDEAKGRFNGKRHAAVWGVVGDLFGAGLTDDEIHTLMDDFPAAVAKAEDEHDGYDVHADVERRLGTLRHAQAIVDGTDDHTTHADDDNPFEELSEEDIRAALDTDNPRVKKILEEREARRLADQVEAMRRFMAPPADVSWSMDEAIENPPTDMRFLVDSLAGVKHNVVITAQYKVGKTAFTVASLARSLCDGEKFLDRFAVPEEGRIVGHWNCEMEGRELLDDYARPAGFKHPERLHVANLRGYGVNILSESGRAWTVEWLRSRGVQVWTIDSLARLLRMAGVKEKENDEVLNVLMAIDEIKVAAGVDVTFIIAHTGRADMPEGSERARGATVIDDWADARWIMTRDGDARFLAAEGRGVGLRTTALDFNHDTKVSTLGVGDRHDVRASGMVQAVAEIVRANVGITKDHLVKRVCAACKVRPPKARELIQECDDTGLIRIDEVPNPRGGRASQKHYPVNEGEKVGGATSRRVNMTSANVRTTRRRE